MSKGFQDSRYRDLIGKLVARRKHLGLSQRELAQRLDKHQQFVSRYEIGERRLDVVEFSDVLMALGLDASEMISKIGPKSD